MYRKNRLIPLVIMLLGFNLVIISLVSYWNSTHFSFTLFIPALFGLLISGFSNLAKSRENPKSWGLYTAVLIALLGFAASSMRIPGTYEKFKTIPGTSPLAFYSQTSMAMLCLLIVILGAISYFKSKAYNA